MSKTGIQMRGQSHREFLSEYGWGLTEKIQDDVETFTEKIALCQWFHPCGRTAGLGAEKRQATGNDLE